MSYFATALQTRFVHAFLNLNRTIRSFLATGLLGLFALAVTPKIVIHALVVHHRDVHLPICPCAAEHLNTASFHCATDNLVVDFPFLVSHLAGPRTVAPAVAVRGATVLVAPLCRFHPLYGLRGPPALV